MSSTHRYEMSCMTLIRWKTFTRAALTFTSAVGVVLRSWMYLKTRAFPDCWVVTALGSLKTITLLPLEDSMSASIVNCIEEVIYEVSLWDSLVSLRCWTIVDGQYLHRVDTTRGMPTMRRGNQIHRIHDGFEIVTGLRKLFLDWENMILHQWLLLEYGGMKLENLRKHEKPGPRSKRAVQSEHRPMPQTGCSCSCSWLRSDRPRQLNCPL